jgi:hypothetical protein
VVRQSAIGYLACDAKSRDLPRLRSLLDQENPKIQEAVLRLLERLHPGEEVEKGVSDFPSTPHGSLRAQAARTLGAYNRLDLILGRTEAWMTRWSFWLWSTASLPQMESPRS